MSYLIDTCCISELVKKKPNQNVVKWFSDQDELSMYLRVITFGELRKGIEKLPDSKKKRAKSLGKRGFKSAVQKPCPEY